jgi:branched-chain amino acid transport system substrate-binding protein
MPSRRRVLALIPCGPAAVLGLPALAQPDRRSILLGQSAPLSGPAAQLGSQMSRGARLYFERLNQSGGINGRSIELRTLDDGYEPDRCRSNTDSLINKDGAFALFGYVGTPTSLAALPLVNAANIPFCFPFTGAEALRVPFNRNVFHVRASYYNETALIVNQLHGLGLDRVAVFRQNDSYGQAGLDGVTRALQTHGLQAAAIGMVERNSTDVAAAVRAILPTQPNAVVLISAYKSCAAFVREARRAGYGGTFYNVSFVGTQALADELGKDGLGVVVSQVMPFPFSSTAAVVREYRQALEQSDKELLPNYSSMEGYVAAKVFTEGLRRAGPTLARDSLIRGLESLQRFDVGGYVVGFSPSNHQGSSFVELSMLTGDGKVRR